MISQDDLRARVAEVYGRLALPSWPDPHPDMASPREDEYSRVTDPGRYRIVHARTRAWTAVLRDALGAEVQPLTSVSGQDGGRGRAFDRGVRLVPGRAGALPLVLLERDVADEADADPLAVVEIGVSRPDLVVEAVPTCGCDACDSGSDDLLEAIDTAVGAVVVGPYVVLQGPTWRAQWHPGGGALTSDGHGPDFDDLMALCQRLAEGADATLPAGTEAFVGTSWLT